MRRKFSATCRVFRRGCWNCILIFQGNTIANNSFVTNFFFIFGHWAVSLTNIWKKFSGVVRSGFSVSMETFGWISFRKLTKCYFLKIERKNFGRLSTKKSAGLSSCFLILHRNILQKKSLKSNFIFADSFRINFGNWAGKVWLACQNLILRIYRNVFWK